MIPAHLLKKCFKQWTTVHEETDFKTETHVQMCLNMFGKLEGLRIEFEFREQTFGVTVETLCIDEFCCYEQSEEDVVTIFNQFKNMNVEIIDWFKSNLVTLCFRYKDDYSILDTSWTYVKTNHGYHELKFNIDS
jgi:hypothetical protein